MRRRGVWWVGREEIESEGVYDEENDTRVCRREGACRT
jgi:hypothetical protein